MVLASLHFYWHVNLVIMQKFMQIDCVTNNTSELQ